MTPALKFLALTALPVFISIFINAQTTWNTSGNTSASSSIFGTLNNQPLIFYTNGIETMRLKPNGDLRINTLSGTGNNFVFSSSNGVLFTKPFSNDTDRFMTEAGTFRSASCFTGWKMVGNNIHSVSGTFVGIGNTNPQFILDVNGDVHFNGIVNAMGINIVNKLQADTIKGAALVKVNNTLNLTGGTYNSIYTSTGDLQLQSNASYAGNTLMNVTNGNVGVGIFSPQYKLDVNGDERVSGKIYVHRIVPLPGDSEIHFGDSSLVLGLTRIYNNSGSHGVGIGYQTFGSGYFSVAIGNRVSTTTPATNSVTIGCGVINGPILSNSIPYSFGVGFNSTVPTFFVGPANGVGTIGKVGVGTNNPQGDFQVGNGWSSVSMGAGTGTLFSTSYFGFNVANSGTQWISQGNGFGNGGVAMFGTINGSLEIVSVPLVVGGVNQTVTDAQMQANDIFEIRPDGKVVIAQMPQSVLTPGSYRLYVSDGIITEKLKVVTVANWSDYIFDSTYVLPPLDTVANFIHTYHHLPGVQTAQEVKKDGIDLAGTDATLLAKIEELTLYMIQLQQQNAAMQKEIEELKKK
jgi:hypothetical protein